MKYTSPGIEGWMSDYELQWLFERAQKMGSVVEIGSWKGRSTHAILSGCAGVVYAVDHFQGNVGDDCFETAKREDIFQIFSDNTAGFENLVPLQMDSAAASCVVTEDVDMVFIDATHTYEAVLQDIKLWLPKTKKLICGHDYDMTHDQVMRAVQEVFGAEGIQVTGTVWYKELCT